MVELFRYIEQEFIAPSRERDPIDLAADSEFQNQLKARIVAGADQRELRGLGDEFLATVAGGDPLPRLPRYHELRQSLLRLRSASHDTVAQRIQEALGQAPAALVNSADFKKEKRLLNDAIFAIKLVTGFDRVNAAAMAAMRQTIAFIEDVAAGADPDLSPAGLSRRLNRPLRIPDTYLSRPPAETPTPPDRLPPRPDPAAAAIEQLRRDQAIFRGGYEMLMALHPSQLEIRTTPEGPGEPPPLPDRENHDGALAPATSAAGARGNASGDPADDRYRDCQSRIGLRVRRDGGREEAVAGHLQGGGAVQPAASGEDLPVGRPCLCPSGTSHGEAGGSAAATGLQPRGDPTGRHRQPAGGPSGTGRL
jgi:hypothetical protein